MNPLEQLHESCPTIESKLNYTFSDKELLINAFIHRSFVNENRELTNVNNERLEFLGDSVLSLIISEYLYRYLPEMAEGKLSSLRSRLVEASSCMRYVVTLQVEEHVLMSRGEQLNAGRGRESILANLFEAIIGAIFLDGGFEIARHFFFKNFSEQVNEILSNPPSNFKAQLQEFSQKEFNARPEYIVDSVTGPDHHKTFTVNVFVDQRLLGTGSGNSKKEAQQAAAEAALNSPNLQK